LRTRGFRFASHLGGITAATSTTLGALGLAAFATFGFVLKTFVGEKHLFASSKNKLGTAFRTL
jgi:hypothetical protein